MGSWRLPPTSPSPFTDRRAAVTALSLMALISLPPWGTSPASASPGSQADLYRHERHVIRLLPTRGHDASRASSCPARIVISVLENSGPGRLGITPRPGGSPRSRSHDGGRRR